jgi:DNA-directed RNA polymerase subunit delta
MGGHQVPERGPNDDGYEEDGYDESQRAEILEATRDGPGDGVVLTDLAPDLGDGDDPAEDDIDMLADDLGEEDEDAEQDADDIEEDELQSDFDDDATASDDDLDDRDRAALDP